MKPHIISVSRREDIPAFRSEWFIDAIKKGDIQLSNGFMDYTIDFCDTKFAVFWTKNPKPLMEHLDQIPFDYYFQFTLNYYPEYELNVPPIQDRIKTFRELSNKIGKERVIWRFDPIIINDKLNSNNLINRIKNIGDKIYKYTDKLVFSYVDPYRKLKGDFIEISDDNKILIARNIIKLNEKWRLKLATCSESINLDGIEHNKCIDPDLIEKLCGPQEWIINKKDKNQRLICGCIMSSDIGTYKKCKHNCQYCYAK